MKQSYHKERSFKLTDSGSIAYQDDSDFLYNDDEDEFDLNGEKAGLYKL